MSDEELPSTSQEAHAEKEEVKRTRSADGHEKQNAEVSSSSVFGGERNMAGRRSSVHICRALDVYYSVFQSMFCGFDKFACRVARAL